ncbi:hypothetical protein ABPG74_016466 [Tetrahymena malaccensis]
MQKKAIKKEKVYDSDNDSVISSSESDRSTSPQQKSKKQKIASNISSPNLNQLNKQSADNNNKNQQGSLNSSLMQSRSNILSQMTPQQQSLNQIRSIIQSFYIKQQHPQQLQSQINQHQSDQQQSQLKMSLLEQQNRQYLQKIKSIEQAKNSDSKVIKNSIAQIQSQLFDIRHKVESINSKSKEKNQKTIKQNEKSNAENNKNNQKENKIKRKHDQEKVTSDSTITSSDGDEKSLTQSLTEDEESMIEYSSNSKRKDKKKNKKSGITENIKGYLILNAHKLQHEGKKNQLLKEILNKKIPDQTTLSNHLVMERYDIVLRDILDVFLEYLLRSDSLHVNTAYIMQTEKNNMLKKSVQTNSIKQVNASPQKQQFDTLKKHEIQLNQKNNQNLIDFANSDHYHRYSQNRLTTNESSGGQVPYSNNTIQPFSHSISKANSQNPIIQQISQNNIDQASYRKSLNNDSRMQQLLSPPLTYSNQQNYPVINIDSISNINDHQTVLNQGNIGSHGRNPSSTKSASSKQISFHNQVSSSNQHLQLNSGNSRGSIDWYQQQMKSNKRSPQQINMTQQSSSRLNREGSQGILKQNNVSYFINTEDQGFESKGSASTKMSENARKNQRLNHAISESQINLLKQNQIQRQFLQQQQYQQGISQIPQILQNNQLPDNFGIIHSFSNFQNSLSPKNNQDPQSSRNPNNLKINQVESLMGSQFQNNNQDHNNASLYGNQRGIIPQIGGNISNLSQNHQSLFSSPNKQAQLFQFQHKYSSSLPFESFMNLNASTSKNNDSLEHNHSRFLQSTSNPSRDYYSPDFKQRMMVNGFSKEILNIYPEQLFFQNDPNNLHERHQNQQILLNNQGIRIDQDIQNQDDYNNHQLMQQDSQDLNKLIKSTSIQKNMQMNSQDQIVSEENYQEDTTSLQEQNQNSRQKIAHSKSLNLLTNKSKLPQFSPENTPTSLKSPSIIKKNPQLKLMPCHKHNKSATIVVKRKNSDNSDHSNSISNITNSNINNNKQQQSNQQKCSNCLIINNREEVKQRFQKLPPSIEQVGRKGKNSLQNNNIKEVFNYNLEKQQSASQK